MNYIRITEETIDREHICCAMSGKQSHAKKEWLKHGLPKVLSFTAVKSGASALSNTFPQRTHGCPSRRLDISTSTVYGFPAP